VSQELFTKKAELPGRWNKPPACNMHILTISVLVYLKSKMRPSVSPITQRSFLQTSTLLSQALSLYNAYFPGAAK
jgi:hypothetical protein